MLFVQGHSAATSRYRPDRMSASEPRPIVAVPACRRTIDPHPFHVAGEKYLTALADAAGVLPLIMPALDDEALRDTLLARVDGVFLTGSYSNVEPHHYGGEDSRSGTLHDPERDAVTLPLLTAIVDHGLPVFAVCRGFQEVNVAMGGTLHQHVEEVGGYADHRENPQAPLEVQYGPAHPVNLVPGGLLRELAETDTVMVNSLHSQGVARLGAGLTVEAVAEDGLVEAFRVDDSDGFALAVQWHPEWRATENAFSRAMFAAFGDACRAHLAAR